MMSFAPGLQRLAAAFFCAAVVFPLCAAEPELPPSKRNAPKGQHIEFTPASAPQLPKPTTAKEAMEERQPMARESGGDAGFGAGMTPSMVPMPAPTKAFKDRMKQKMDKEKNWMVPGAQDDFLGISETWAIKGVEKNDPLDSTEKNKSVLERFLTSETKTKPDRPDKRGEEKKDKEDNYTTRADRESDKTLDNRDRDPREDSKGISDFNLHGFLSGNDRRNDGSHKEPEGTKGFQPIRAEIVGDPNRALRERDRDREREATRAAQFEQMIAPRGAGTRVGIPDPINSGSDLTRRDLNPILPRVISEPVRPEASPFNAPISGGPRFQDQGMLGVASPGLPSFGSPASSPAMAPTINFRPAQSIILEPPKRKFN